MPLKLSQHPAKFCPLALCQWNYSGFRLLRNLAKPHDSMVMWFYVWESHLVRHSPATFGGHRHHGSENVFNLSRDIASPRDQKV